MNDNELRIIRHLRNLRPSFLQDGRIDLVETAFLLKSVHAVENDVSPEIRAFADLLREVREDGVVTFEESDRILRAMDGLLARVDDGK